MLSLSIAELEEITGGHLRLASMPPLAGVFEPIRRIVVDSNITRPGDVFWALEGQGYDGPAHVEEAFSRGALGTVLSGRLVEPWAGKFCLDVRDSGRAFCRLVRCLRETFHEGKSPLVLNLTCAAYAVRSIQKGNDGAVVEILEQLAEGKRSLPV